MNIHIKLKNQNQIKNWKRDAALFIVYINKRGELKLMVATIERRDLADHSLYNFFVVLRWQVC